MERKLQNGMPVKTFVNLLAQKGGKGALLQAMERTKEIQEKAPMQAVIDSAKWIFEECERQLAQGDVPETTPDMIDSLSVVGAEALAEEAARRNLN